MKITLLVICCMTDILIQNAYAVKKKTAPIPVTDTEPEESDQNKSTYLEELIYKAIDSNEDSSVSLINKRPPSPKPVPPKKNIKKIKVFPKKPAQHTKSKTPLKKHKKYRKILGQVSYPNSMEKDIQKRLKREVVRRVLDDDAKNKITSDMDTEGGESSDSQHKDDGIGNRHGKLKTSIGRKGSQNDRKTHNQNSHTELRGSVEDETLEEDVGLGRRNGPEKRKFEDVYRYENEPLKNMLLWLVMNSQNPTVKNAIKASKTSVDKYVKHTVDKAGVQAALRYTDYTSVRFDKDRIIMYCGGQMFVYNTMRDSKICFNGQIYEVRLI